jgi:TolA-binding protein
VIGVRWLYVERRSHQKATASVSGSVKPSLPDILQLDRPAAVSPPALIWRGAKPEQGLDEGLRSALDLYRKGDDDAARALLETLTVNYPNSAEPFFYLGICQLFLGQNTEAVTSLRRSRQLATEPLASEAAWYLSVALVREGNRSQAAEILKQLCQSPGSYQTRACAGLDELSRPQNSQP